MMIYLIIGACVSMLALFLEYIALDINGVIENYDMNPNMDTFIRCCLSIILMLSWPIVLILVIGVWPRSKE